MCPPTILVVHNYYQQPGGEDRSFAAEAELLESRGHRVVRYTVHNDQIDAMPRGTAAAKALWNRASYRALRALIRKERPGVMHCTNTFPLVSPSAYYAAYDEGVAVVQSLRNYRLSCVNGLFFREGQVCESCLGRVAPWPGVLRGCYRSSRSASAVVAAMLTGHRLLGTWTRRVDRYVALCSFARDKFVEAGLPPEKISIKPNFLPVPPPPGNGQGGYALFVGRLSSEKGLRSLVEAWDRLARPMVLKVVGDGPLAPLVREAAARLPDVEWLGRQPATVVQELMGAAQAVVIPSTCYEGFPRVLLEALAVGTPLIASDLGAMAELVDPGRTGLLFAPGDPGRLAAAVARMQEDPEAWHAMRPQARATFEARYTAARNYEMLCAIYGQSTEAARRRLPASSLPG